MSKVNIIFCAVLAIALFIIGFQWIDNHRLSNDFDATKRDYKRASRRSQQKIDSMVDLTERSEARVLGMQHYIEMHEDSLRDERADRIKWQNAYVKSTRTHIDRSTPDDKLDSAVTRLLTAH